MEAKVVAIAVADIHLSHAAPIARAKEPDWYVAMARPLQEIQKLVGTYNAPVLISGDIFDRWNPCPELINFFLGQLQDILIYAIPGQHDLPYHSHAEIEKSGYWTLVKANKIEHVDDKERLVVVRKDECFWVSGFGWNTPVRPPSMGTPDVLHVCLHHAYRWMPGYGHAKARDEDLIDTSVFYDDNGNSRHTSITPYTAYDVVITGDNHIPFDVSYPLTTYAGSRTKVCNVGSLMRRSSDQLGHRPRAVLIRSDGTVKSHYLDVSKDVFNPVIHDHADRLEPGLEAFLNSLRDSGPSSLDYRDALTRAIEANHLSDGARKYLLEALEQHHG